MKIVIDSIGVRDGGAVRLLDLYLVYLCARRPEWEWTLCVLPQVGAGFDPTNLPANARICVVDKASNWIGRLLWLGVRLPMFLRAQNASLVFSFANLLPIFLVTPAVLFLQQVKIFESLSGATPVERLRLGLLRLYTKITARRAARVIVQSGYMKDKLVAHVKGIHMRVSVVPSPAAPFVGRHLNSALMATLSKCGRPVISYISLPRGHKNHVNLLRAFAKVHNEIPGATLLLTVPGPGDWVGDPIIRKIHDEASTLGITDSLIWLGHLTLAEVELVYSKSDVTVFPSLAESFGMPLAEAVSANVPTIASDLPFAREVLGEAGVYFDPTSPEDMARVIVDTLKSSIRMEELRAEASKRREMFLPEVVAERVCVLIERSVYRNYE